ncbi:AsmA family protein [Massilia sp. CF038]|uniref:AsmA family protein n=1 Tax=Massilia sp. CF038 TaxID=1881045 RepID=UPI000919175F|nr:AsmA family protein [Massilia sp. CF038]SHH67541.1 AsmA protein [Massilia sp. CF038]
MARYLKFAALTAGMLLLVLLAAAAIFRACFNPNDYKTQIVQLVQQQHQRTLSIPGNITLILAPRLGANLGRVTLSERGGAGEFAAIDSARFSVAWLPLLLEQKVVIDRVDVRGMRASVVRHADGSMNTGDLTSGRGTRAAAPQAAPGGIGLAIDSIRFDNARLLFDDRKTGRTLDISHLNIDSGAIAPGVASRLAMSANIRINKPAMQTALTLTGKFVPDPALRRVAFSELDANLDLSLKNAKVKLGGQMALDLERDEFAADLKGRFDDSAFDVKTGLRAGAYHLTLHVDKLDLGRYQDRLVPDVLPNDPTPPAPGDAFDLSPLANLRASGGIHVGQLQVGTLHASNVRAALRSVPGKLMLEPVVAKLYEGSGSGSVMLDFSRSASMPHITVVQTLTGVRLGALLRDLMGKAPVDGRGDVLIDVNMEGSSTAQMRQALAGSAALRLKDASVHGIDVPAILADGPQAHGMASAHERSSFGFLNASFTIANGVAHNADLAGETALISVAGAGDIDLAREQLDYTFAATLKATGLSMPIRLSGPWTALAWQVEPQAGSGAAVSQKARDKLKKTIRGLLKR